MDYTADLSAVSWLNPSFYSDVSTEPLKVKHLIPREYQQYLALLPDVGMLKDFPFEQVEPDSTDINQINRNVAIWKHYGVNQRGKEPDYQPTNFQQLAAQFKLPYALSLVTQLPWGKEGFATLAEPTTARLLELLRRLAPATKLNLYVEDYWRWGRQMHKVLPTDDEVLYRVTGEEFISFYYQSGFDSTVYLFPDDRSWCLVNVEDGLCPIIAGDERMATIAAQAEIELLPLTPESKIFEAD